MGETPVGALARRSADSGHGQRSDMSPAPSNGAWLLISSAAGRGCVCTAWKYRRKARQGQAHSQVPACAELVSAVGPVQLHTRLPSLVDQPTRVPEAPLPCPPFAAASCTFGAPSGLSLAVSAVSAVSRSWTPSSAAVKDVSTAFLTPAPRERHSFEPAATTAALRSSHSAPACPDIDISQLAMAH